MFSPTYPKALIGFAYLFSSSFAASCAGEWSQCGGISWTGASCCGTGNTCTSINSYYYQCQATTILMATTTKSTTPASTTSAKPSSSSKATTASSTGGTTLRSTTSTTNSPSSTSSKIATSSSAKASTTVVTPNGASIYTTSIAASTTSHAQSPYPVPAATDSCGAWTLLDNVCCPTYCSDILTSEDCNYSAAACGSCISPPSADCKSGTMYPEVLSVGDNEAWHYSRSTHFGLTDGGACGFGLYGLCTTGGADASWIEPEIKSTCAAFCTAYPLLCQDPTSTNLTMRGNFAAPNGDYYSQFWPSLPGNLDNYLSCGECFELSHTMPDGTAYTPGEAGYTPPIILEIVDSCPCSANSKWCCGPGADHCAEIDFKYGCPLPAGSIHLDLSDIAMGRLQGNGSLNAGVIPTQYKRIPCPVPGNVYIWLRDGGGPYYFALSIVNTFGLGSITSIEVMGSGSTTWTALTHDPNYTSSRPQERYGSWTIPTGAGPFNTPVAMRITNPAGQQIVNMNAINSYTAPASAPAGWNYIDFGAQFSE